MQLRFTADGVLPPRDHDLTIEELRASMLVTGPEGHDPGWDSSWRAKLVDNLTILVRQLWTVGIEEIFIDGSFAQDKNRPNDIDGYFVCDLRQQVSGELERKLNALDPHRAWGWSEHIRYPGRLLPLQRIYKVVLWPYSLGTMWGTDNRGKPVEMSDAFRRVAGTSIRKGIIRLRPPQRSS